MKRLYLNTETAIALSKQLRDSYHFSIFDGGDIEHRIKEMTTECFLFSWQGIDFWIDKSLDLL